MKLSECTHGKLVYKVAGLPEDTYTIIGMIVGITENGFGEAIPLVQWQNNSEAFSCHYGNLSLYEE